MAAQGGYPRTWLYAACFMLCGCTAHKGPAANGGAGTAPEDAGSDPGPAADGGSAESRHGGGSLAEADAACEPASCEAQAVRCGAAHDGCGATLSCGTCQPSERCVDNECRTCTPTTCSQLQWQCGTGSDDCGGTIDCGTCTAASGNPICSQHQCCTPRTCPADGCGELPDGCGGQLQCGACPELIEGKICGYADAKVCSDERPACSCELPFVCDPRNGECCVPLACADLCRQGSYDGNDGCGATIHCDACPAR